MSSLDSQQVTLALTKIPFIIKELERKGRLVRNADGNQCFRIQFDSHTFEFVLPKPKDGVVGNSITVGKSVAECLIQDSCVIVGASIDGQVYPALESVREFDLSLGEKENPNTCSYCKGRRAFESARELADHILEEHADPVDDKPSKSKEAIA